jgi:hypothetical protein
MKNKDLKLNFNNLPEQLGGLMRKISAYKVFLFFLAVASLYGYILWRINTFSNAPPSQEEETAQTTAQPHIDAATVQKIQSLQDNSVNVQALFDIARQNPFQE